jgi:hypothetical protein
VLGPIGVTLVVFAVAYAFTMMRALRETGGHLTYALDDAYIHMAMARNLALDGVWGVQSDSFAAASSSPLWTALLGTSFRVAGVSDVIPLVLNTVLAILCIATVALVLEHERVPNAVMFAVIPGVVLITPLVPMVWIGMEHTLHILLTLMVVWGVTASLKRHSVARIGGLCGLVMLMVATRYEGEFVVAGGAVVFALARRVGAAVAIIIAGALPIIGIGAWNVTHGWFFLPASIMMKQTVLPATQGSSLLGSIIGNVAHANAPPAFLVLLGVAVLLLTSQRRSNRQPLLVIFVTASVFHLAFAKFGWLFRYESYLMTLGATAVAAAAVQAERYRTGWRLRAVTAAEIAVVVVIALLAAADRTIASHAVTADVAGHIFRQHRQIAELLRRYYDRDPVAVNDIGVVSYYSQARIYDLVGLGSLEVATLRRSGSWDAAHMNGSLSRANVSVAVVYDTWFQGTTRVTIEAIRSMS